MARTKKVGITGRFGARYGRKAKRSVKIIEENMKKNHVCPKCDRPYVKRVSAGIWECKKCGEKILISADEVSNFCPYCGEKYEDLLSAL